MEHAERILPTHILAAAGIVTNEQGEILLVNNFRRGWEFPGGIAEVGENMIDAVRREVLEESGVEIEVGEVVCISSNTNTYPGYNGVKEVPTKLILDFLCRSTGGVPRASEENSESAFFPKDQVCSLLQASAIRARFQAYLEYTGRPVYLEYVTKPEFQLKLKRLL